MMFQNPKHQNEIGLDPESYIKIKCQFQSRKETSDRHSGEIFTNLVASGHSIK